MYKVNKRKLCEFLENFPFPSYKNNSSKDNSYMVKNENTFPSCGVFSASGV